MPADESALCSRIRTVSAEHRIADVVGSVPDDRMDEIDSALEYSLGLTQPIGWSTSTPRAGA